VQGGETFKVRVRVRCREELVLRVKA